MIRGLRRRFGVEPVTCHLIVDVDPAAGEAWEFLRGECAAGTLEVVFHGSTHCCPQGTARWLAWYHKNQAEFLGRGFDAEVNARRYRALNAGLGHTAAICPPCWLAGREGRAFLVGLMPAYLEFMFSLQVGGRRSFSPVVGLGGLTPSELFFLRAFSGGMRHFASWVGARRLRLVVHPVDLENERSLRHLEHCFTVLAGRGYRPVLQADLL